MTGVQTCALPISLDTPLPLTTNFTSLVTQLKNTGQMVYTPWASGLTQWTLVVEGASAQVATAVHYRLTLEVGLVHEEAVSSVKLRNR